MVRAVYQNPAIIGVQMSQPEMPHRSRVPWALAVTVGLCSGLAGYVIHAARVNRIPKQVVTVNRLTDMPGPEKSPAISPDEKNVAFVAGPQQIWIQPLAASRRLLVTLDDASLAEPRWASDSRSLIYFSSGAIWEIPVQGGQARRLVDSKAEGDISHDGARLAFFRFQGGDVEIAVAGRDGSDPRSLTKFNGDNLFGNLRWSPDDKKIAYMQDSNLMVADLSGGEPVRAAGGDLTIQDFTWAPDNSGLIVSSTQGRTSFDPLIFNLWFIPRVEGRSASQLTFGELSYESPDVSAGGNLMVCRQSLYGSRADSDIVMFSGLKW